MDIKKNERVISELKPIGGYKVSRNEKQKQTKKIIQNTKENIFNFPFASRGKLYGLSPSVFAECVVQHNRKSSIIFVFIYEFNETVNFANKSYCEFSARESWLLFCCDFMDESNKSINWNLCTLFPASPPNSKCQPIVNGLTETDVNPISPHHSEINWISDSKNAHDRSTHLLKIEILSR